ncbi:F-box protein CPR1-like [Cornus florida]|uniref:F-box protein CPR1-like n=1 Tax=Cornus florida TaxID=4283 RepID=UPI0028999A97|nr:F-box protein CPR1-like [Cornus florida]
MSEIPLQVVADILSRLPVKPLLRFRCVSKSWCALIDDPHFIKSHLNQSIKTNSNRRLIFSDFDLFSIDLDSPSDDDDEEEEVEELDLHLYHPLKNEEKTKAKRHCPWNPSTRKHHKLPVTPIEFSRKHWSSSDTIYGFGYDGVSDDYKVVRIVEYYSKDDGDSFDSEVKVCNLKSNTWRRIQALPCYLLYDRNATLANGALHWLVCRKPYSDRANLIAAFDLGVEEYRLVPQPDYSDKSFEMNVVVLGEWLCVLCHIHSFRVELWVTKEYGIKESWTRLFSVLPTEISSYPSDAFRPLAFSRSGGEVILLQDCERFLWFDLKYKIITKAKKNYWEELEGPFICFGSLVPLPL